MKFNLFYTYKGPARTIEAPNPTNPQEAEGLEELLNLLCEHFNTLPMNKSIVGLRIEETKGDTHDESNNIN